jgi:hypothetical protein
MWHISVQKREGKRPPARPRPILEDNINNNLKETRWTWTELIWLRIRNKWQTLMNNVKNHEVPESLGIFLTSSETISFLRTLLYGETEQP